MVQTSAISVPILAIVTYLSVSAGKGLPIGIYLVVAAMNALAFLGGIRMRIEVSKDSLEYRPGVGVSRRLMFQDIIHTKALKGSNPLYLCVTTRGRKGQRNVYLRMLPFRPNDVKWLMSLPELKLGNE